MGDNMLFEIPVAVVRKGLPKEVTARFDDLRRKYSSVPDEHFNVLLHYAVTGAPEDDNAQTNIVRMCCHGYDQGLMAITEAKGMYRVAM